MTTTINAMTLVAEADCIACGSNRGLIYSAPTSAIAAALAARAINCDQLIIKAKAG